MANGRLISVLSALFYSSLIITGEAQSTRPNIVFILADDYGYNDIGYHAREHQSDMKTPFLDELAENGIKFENYYVQPICSPTRSQLMSGRYQIHTGLQHQVIWPNQPNALPLDDVILPEQLRNCGYDTHMVGKWHLGFYKSEFLPWNRGFNSYYGFLIGGEDYYTKYRCFQDYCGYGMWDSKRGPVNDTWGEYSAHLFGRKAIEAIDNRDPSKPMFLYLAYQSVHSPMQVPDEYVKPFEHIQDKNRRTYAGMVNAMDESIKNVTQHLERAGILNNTIIIFSTDNGGQTMAGGNNWPLRGRKGTLWEGGVKGVGFAYGTPLKQTGIEYQGLLHVSDWYPTLINAARCPISNLTNPLDGFNQWDAIRGNSRSERTEILHNIDPIYVPNSMEPNGVFDSSIHAAIRKGPWKLMTGKQGFDQWVKPPEWVQPNPTIDDDLYDVEDTPTVRLYHIDTDPYEKYDIASEFPSVVKDLLQRLAVYNSTAVPVRFPPQDPRADPKLHGGYWGPWLDNIVN